MAENQLLKRFKNIFSLDLRGIAVFRILFGFMILYDVIDRMMHTRAHYSDYGIMPREVVLNEDWLDWLFSFHLMNGEVYWQVILFSINALLAISLMLGYRTKTSLFLCWIFMHSVHARNSLITTGGDNVMRMMAFWALFLPLAAMWSVDKYLDKNKAEARPAFQTDNPYATTATLAYIVQLISIYFFSVFLKTGATWENGTAVYYTLQLEHYTTWLGQIFGQYFGLTKFLTYFTLVLERFGFLLFFIPFKWQWFRFTGVTLYMSLHFGFFLTMNLGIFPWICIVAWTACLPPMFWDFIFGTNIFKQLKFGITHRVGGLLEYLKAKSYINTKKVLTYDGGLVAQVLVFFFMVLVLWWNTMRVDVVKMPDLLEDIVRVTRINQKWGMFAPNPSKSDGWYVIPGRFSNGTELDLHTGKPVSYEKPDGISASYTNHRWRKYFNNFHRKSKSKFRKHYGRFLANKWKDELEGTGVKLETFEIIFMEEKTKENYETHPVKKHSLWKHWTDKKFKKRFFPDEDKDKKSDKKDKKTSKPKVPQKDERGVIIEETIPGGQEKIGSADDAIMGGGDKDESKPKTKDKDQNLDGE